MLFSCYIFLFKSICCFSKSTILISSLSLRKENTNTVFTGPQAASDPSPVLFHPLFLRSWGDFSLSPYHDTDSWVNILLVSSYPGCLETLHLSFDSNKATLAFQ